MTPPAVSTAGDGRSHVELETELERRDLSGARPGSLEEFELRRATHGLLRLLADAEPVEREGV